LSSLFSVPGSVLESVSIDFMHTADLGITLHFLGNVIWEVFRQLRSTAAIKTAKFVCAGLFQRLRETARSLGVQLSIGNLTVTMFKQDGKVPALKYQTVCE
jgi:hypothetical protein